MAHLLVEEEKMQTTKNNFYVALTSITLLSSSLPVFAASFGIKEQSVTNLGNAYAGTAAQADDASTAFYNAAGLTKLKNDQVTVSAIGMRANIKLEPSAATNTGAGNPLTLADSTMKSGVVVPGMHVAKRVSDKIVFGLSAASPFGLKTNYADDSTARVMARRSELKTYEISPSLAYAINERWSIGAGANALHGRVRLDVDSVVPDGFVGNAANGWGYGYHVGLLFQPDAATRMGIQYRSRIKVKGKGDSVSTVAGRPNLGVEANLTLPDSVTYSVYHQYDDKWSMLGDIEFTHWSLFKELRLDYSNGTATITPEHYKNTMRVALGTNYKATEKMTWKLGFAYDQSPTVDEYRTARIPDSDRFWLSMGGKYETSKRVAISFGYARLFFKRATLDEAAPLNENGVPAGLQSLKGTYKTHADIVGIQLTWNFV